MNHTVSGHLVRRRVPVQEAGEGSLLLVVAPGGAPEGTRGRWIIGPIIHTPALKAAPHLALRCGGRK